MSAGVGVTISRDRGGGDERMMMGQDAIIVWLWVGRMVGEG